MLAGVVVGVGCLAGLLLQSDIGVMVVMVASLSYSGRDGKCNQPEIVNTPNPSRNEMWCAVNGGAAARRQQRTSRRAPTALVSR